jgi:cellulose synthase/poly-beta-1,6-N-acetylglucosamine synthase-like glycosyltransferase
MILVTDNASLSIVQGLLVAASIVGKSPTQVIVSTIRKASKRRQMAQGIKAARGTIILFADDDVFWPPNLLCHVLRSFEDLSVRGVGVLQMPDFLGHPTWNLWHSLETLRLERRMRRVAANLYIDGGTTCLSGRTVAYRAHILKNEGFIQAFTQDFWGGHYLLDSGDDVFITHWLLKHSWLITMQVSPDAAISTSLAGNSKYLLQLLRWTRNSKRGQILFLYYWPWVWR